MKTLVIAFAALIPFITGCGGQETSTESVEQAAKVCPYAVPYCDPTHCKLVGGCPEQCVCDNGASTQCGPDLRCGANTYCCNSTTAGYECLPIGYLCPL